MLGVSLFLISVNYTAGVYLLVTQKSIMARRYDFLDDPLTLVSLSFLSLFPWGLGGLGSERVSFHGVSGLFMPPDESCFLFCVQLGHSSHGIPTLRVQQAVRQSTLSVNS